MKRKFLNVDPISGIATHAGFALIFFTSALLLFLKKHNNEFSFKELQTFIDHGLNHSWGTFVKKNMYIFFMILFYLLWNPRKCVTLILSNIHKESTYIDTCINQNIWSDLYFQNFYIHSIHYK